MLKNSLSNWRITVQHGILFYLQIFYQIIVQSSFWHWRKKKKKKTKSRIQPLICWVMYLSEDSLLWKCVHRLCDDAQPLCPQARRGQKQRVASSTGQRLHRPVLHLHQKVNTAEQLHEESTHACVTGNAGVSVLLMSPVKMCIFICVELQGILTKRHNFRTIPLDDLSFYCACGPVLPTGMAPRPMWTGWRRWPRRLKLQELTSWKTMNWFMEPSMPGGMLPGV